MKIYINGTEINADLREELNRRIEKNQRDYPHIFVHINRSLPLSFASQIAARVLAVMR